jgi:hypothetical protein
VSGTSVHAEIVLPPSQAPDPRRVMIRAAAIACTVVGTLQAVVGALAERTVGSTPIAVGGVLAVAGAATWLWDRFHDDDGGGGSGGGGGGRGRRELAYIPVRVDDRPRYPGRQL